MKLECSPFCARPCVHACSLAPLRTTPCTLPHIFERPPRDGILPSPLNHAVRITTPFQSQEREARWLLLSAMLCPPPPLQLQEREARWLLLSAMPPCTLPPPPPVVARAGGEMAAPRQARPRPCRHALRRLLRQYPLVLRHAANSGRVGGRSGYILGGACASHLDGAAAGPSSRMHAQQRDSAASGGDAGLGEPSAHEGERGEGKGNAMLLPTAEKQGPGWAGRW